MSFLEPLSKVATNFRGKMRQLFGCILKDRYVVPAVLSPGPEALCWISSKMHKFPRWDSENPQLIFFRLWLFCVVTIYLTHMLPALPLALTLNMCTSIHINFQCVYSLEHSLCQPHSNLFSGYSQGTPTLSKSINMDIWVVGISNQLHIRGS